MSMIKDKLGTFFEKIQLEDSIYNNLYFAYREEYQKINGADTLPPDDVFDSWLAKNVGIVNDIEHPFWTCFYVVDRKLFTMAMLKYSS